MTDQPPPVPEWGRWRLYIDVDQIARLLVLVAADRFTGGAVDVGETVDPTTHENGVHRRGRHPQRATVTSDRFQHLVADAG